MKTSMKKYLSLVLAICCLFACFIIPEQAITASAAASYSETEFGEGKLLITTERSGKKYYLPATTTSSAPTAEVFSDVSEISEEHLWTVTSDGAGNYYIQNSDGKYLYATNTNNGVRVGDTKGTWTYNAGENYFKFTTLTRYLGLYNTQDWRSYNSVTASNYGESSKSFKFYKVNEVDNSISDPLNAVNAYMSLGYKYTASTQENTEATPSVSTDVINLSFTGQSGTTYGTWSGKTGKSGAVYAGNSAGGNESIQLRSTSNSGIVVTNSAGKVAKITLEWNSNTASGRTVDIYGKNTKYNQASDLYSTSTQGTKIGSITYGTTTELVITGDYEYIGIRSKSSALYLNSITIEWATEAEETITSYNNSDFALRCAIDDSIADIAGVDSFGIKVSTKSKSMEYTSTAKSWTHDEENGLYYITLNLGDIINDIDKLGTEFTVTAFVTVGEDTFASTTAKTHSVASMINDYYKNGSAEVKAAVEHLYNYLDKEGLI